MLNPVTNRLHAAVTLGQAAKLLERKAQQAVGLAITAGVQVAEGVGWQMLYRHLAQRGRVDGVVRYVDGGVVGDVQRARLAVQAQGAIARGGIGVHRVRGVLIDLQALVADLLAGCFGCMDVEDEVGTVTVNVVGEVDLQLKPYPRVGFCGAVPRHGKQTIGAQRAVNRRWRIVQSIGSGLHGQSLRLWVVCARP